MLDLIVRRGLLCDLLIGGVNRELGRNSHGWRRDVGARLGDTLSSLGQFWILACELRKKRESLLLVRSLGVSFGVAQRVGQLVVPSRKRGVCL